MSILDKLKKKKTAPDKKPATKKEKAKDKAAVEKETVQETVVAPDGTLKTVAKKSDKKAKKTKPKKENTGNAYRVLIKPLVTEKSSSLGMYNKYAFEVSPRANKIEVTKAIKKVYGLKPLKVNIMTMSGKNVRYGKTEGRTKFWKKAIITLPEGQKIEIQDGL